MIKKAVVCGGGGFIGSHLVRDLKQKGGWVRAVDLKKPEFSDSAADEFIVGDLRNVGIAQQAVADMEDVYQLAADMGGMGFICGDHDAAIMHNSALINLHVLNEAYQAKCRKIFYSSSACVYAKHNQADPSNPKCSEESAYPAAPDSEYGWEKLFSERLYLTYGRNYGMDVRIARFHNVFGPEGTWTGGREKAPAALCRKVAEAKNGGSIEIWGPGDQTRSFLFIDECLEGISRLMASDFSGPVNIGSEEMISINNLAILVSDIAGKQINIKNIDGPEGVRGRNSDNRLIKNTLGWAPSAPLRVGLEKTYAWINKQVRIKKLAQNVVHHA
ncbi:MAG: NAD-dependent dehydratase [Candidatus Andersenbacteria bacterium RIFCSPLOWO2_02_FULL_46_11]|nr:MAG: NAD-dependent epimerase/dehydratase [Parcubacteria group bacterium GW2011_GWA2_45_14]OGY33267.1 MAG: NAD-dependent dehydratase [Candidatus Andersenbacteria bacterium RIFCSPHIGHO2_02_FULL_46_16]OGY38438.1 MAG: NAD-dependent dehydratase [Candidatus Andersenbacteria bacterium RIFCSPLOWO2_02_FULL_46_11]